MAARSGSKIVYACEQNYFISQAAQQIINSNGFHETIKLIPQKSTSLSQASFNPKPNVLVAEIFDAGLIGELAIPTFRHAMQNLMAENFKIIPAKAQVIGRLVELPSLAVSYPMREVSGFDLSAFDQFRIPFEYISQDLNQVEHRFLSEPFPIAAYDFHNLGEPVAEQDYISDELKVQVTENGTLHGVAFWFDLWLDEEIQISSNPERLDNHWGQAVFFFENGSKAEKNQICHLTSLRNDYKIWFDTNAKVTNV